MNLKLLLLSILFVPFVAKAQTINDEAAPVAFTNSGLMYFGSKKDAGTIPANKQDDKIVMSVFGSALFLEPKITDNAGVTTTVTSGELMMEDHSGMSLTGDWIVDWSSYSDTPAYIPLAGFYVSTQGLRFGFVKFNNSEKAVKIPLYNATKYAKNPGNVGGQTPPAEKEFASLSLANVGGANSKVYLKKKQTIRSYPYTNPASEYSKYKPTVTMPNIVVDTFSYVAQNHMTNLRVGVEILSPIEGGNITINPGGLFSVQARYSTSTTVGSSGGGVSTGESGTVDITNPARQMYIPKLIFRNINYVKATQYQGYDGATGLTGFLGAGQDFKGQVMYDMELFDPTIATPGAAGSNIAGTIGTPGVGETLGEKIVLTPFSSPYAKLGSDYMLFNPLSKVTTHYVAGGTGPIVDEKGFIDRGTAYFIAQNVSDFDHAYIANSVGAHPNLRAHGGYQFNRDYFLAEKGPNFGQNPRNINSVAYKEEFLTPSEDFVVELKKGLNFVANPYFSPLVMEELLRTSNNGLVSWTPSGSPSVTAGDDTNYDLRNRYWVPHSSSIQWVLRSGINYFRYNVQYYDRQAVGGANDFQYVGSMQVFALQASRDVKIILPNSFKTLFNDGEQVPTPRSGISAQNEEVNTRVDEILLQTTVLSTDTRDGGEATPLIVDRVSFVLRPNASLSHTDGYDNEKVLVNQDAVGDRDEDRRRSGAKVYADDDIDPYEGILYTKSSHGRPLMTSILPTTVKQVPVYFTPTQQETRVKLNVGRMETLTSVSRVWLVDKFENNKVIELSADTEYEFISRPLSAELAAENRFVLYFGDQPDEVIVEEEVPMLVYYNTSSLYLEKLNGKDLNSSVQIYDLQGRLVGSTKIQITDIPYMTYSKPLSLGTYIVKVTGKRNYTTKFIVLPH